MRVELAVDLFPNPPSDLHLSAIGLLGVEGKHRIIVENDQDPNFLTWLNGLPGSARQQWDFALAESYLLEAYEPAVRRIRVSRNSNSDWELATPELALEDAQSFLSRPFVAILEDWQSDRAFILAAADTDQRLFLEKMEARHALVFENGGGISNLAKKLEKYGEDGRPATSRTWSMFDSDALQPGQPSAQAARVCRVCIDADIPFHQLQRRSIESYLPREALRQWAYAGTGRRYRARQKAALAFFTLTDDQRHHYNMKEGFRGDHKRKDATAGSLYDGVSRKTQQALDAGFDANIAALFAGDLVIEQHLRDDGAWAELSPMVSSFVRLIR